MHICQVLPYSYFRWPLSRSREVQGPTHSMQPQSLQSRHPEAGGHALRSRHDKQR